MILSMFLTVSLAQLHLAEKEHATGANQILACFLQFSSAAAQAEENQIVGRAERSPTSFRVHPSNGTLPSQVHL